MTHTTPDPLDELAAALARLGGHLDALAAERSSMVGVAAALDGASSSPGGPADNGRE